MTRASIADENIVRTASRGVQATGSSAAARSDLDQPGGAGLAMMQFQQFEEFRCRGPAHRRGRARSRGHRWPRPGCHGTLARSARRRRRPCRAWPRQGTGAPATAQRRREAARRPARSGGIRSCSGERNGRRDRRARCGSRSSSIRSPSAPETSRRPCPVRAVVTSGRSAGPNPVHRRSPAGSCRARA